MGFIVKHRLLISIGWTILIFVLCATPGEYIPSAGWMELLSIDKLVHAFIFFILCAMWLIVTSTPPFTSNWKILVVMLCVSYGVTLEWMQAAYFRHRSFEKLDMVANTFGVMIAYLFLPRLKRALGDLI